MGEQSVGEKNLIVHIDEGHACGYLLVYICMHAALALVGSLCVLCIEDGRARSEVGNKVINAEKSPRGRGGFGLWVWWADGSQPPDLL